MSIREVSETLARYWLAKCNEISGANEKYSIKLRQLPRAEGNAQQSSEELKDVDIYEASYTSGPTNPSMPQGWLLWAVITNNTCVTCVYATLARFKKLLEAVPGVQAVEWMRAAVRPRIVVRWDNDNDHETVLPHDFIRVKLSDGKYVVVDFSGWQFGFDNCFYTWEDYKSNCLAYYDELQRMDVEEERRLYRESLAGDRRGEFLDAAENELQAMTDDELREYGRKVDLSSRTFMTD